MWPGKLKALADLSHWCLATLPPRFCHPTGVSSCKNQMLMPADLYTGLTSRRDLAEAVKPLYYFATFVAICTDNEEAYRINVPGRDINV